MTLLAAGLALFVGGHLLPGVPGLRTALVGKLGELPFKGLVSVFALAGLALVLWGWGDAPTTAMKSAPSWGRHLAWTAVPVAFVMVTAAYVPSRIGWFLGHPMSLGTALWGAVHVVANHEARAVVLFGTLAAWGVVAWLLAGLRIGFRPKPMPERPRDGLLVIAGLGLAGAVMAAHGWLFGIAVIP